MATDVGTLNPTTPLAGRLSTLNITTDTVIKATPGRLFKVSVVVAGSTTPGTINDCATTAAAAAANQIGTAPNVVGTTDFNWPCTTGIVIKIGGGGQVLAVTWE